MRHLVTLTLLLSSWTCTKTIVPTQKKDLQTNTSSASTLQANKGTRNTKTKEPLRPILTVDVFDVRPENVRRIETRFKERFTALRNGVVSEKLDTLPKEIQQWGGFAYVQIAEVNYGGSPNIRAITFDIVDSRDVSTRMNFLARPTGSVEDPKGVLKLWEDYDSIAIQEIVKGNIGQAPWENCPAFHCLLNHEHPALKKKSEALAKRAPSQFEQLVKVLRTDRNSDKRAAAAFLIAYYKDGNKVVEALVPSIRDSSPIVRNNAMRVLAEIALRHQDVHIPLDPILQAIHFPDTTDRNKAAAIIDRLLQRPDSKNLHRRIINQVGEIVLAMLRLKQPNNHDYAYFIFKRLSDKDFGEQNYRAWARWLAEESPIAP